MFCELLPFQGNINFNAQHAPLGAYMSFTCGHFNTAGGIGIEIGKPANQNLYIGVKHGGKKSFNPIRCLPFFKVGSGLHDPASSYEVNEEHAPPVHHSLQPYKVSEIQRMFGWATDTWQTPDFKFTIYSPFFPIPEPNGESETLKACLLPGVVATLEVDNRLGTETKTGVFAIDFINPGAAHFAI